MTRPTPDTRTPPSDSGSDPRSDAGHDHEPRRRASVGVLLVLLGGLALLSNFGLFGGIDNLVGGLLFAAGGAYLVRRYARRDETWALPVGFGLFALAAAALADGPLSGTYFLGLLGVGFVALYWDDRTRWWPLIPGGVLITLGVVAGIAESFPRFDPGPVLFLGIAATFFVLTRLERTPQSWAIYPALGALAVGILSLSFTGGWLFPLLLIGAGVWLLRRGDLGALRGAFGGRDRGSVERSATPEAPRASESAETTAAEAPASEVSPASASEASTAAPTEATEAPDAPSAESDDERRS